ncbi:hypothetical protein PAPYR_13166 [Paratrimastix pyriformis]|uniref:Vesicle transport v-SNARE N-terminal domain-containing protein n=1 Tax=Paratrimastix pyriformis TaxID=342808 RepID=A0ABQ8U0Q6_9EUKA|nr:hypothetical protein PAPYR_13166 [Paratrimastix pyriformis]
MQFADYVRDFNTLANYISEKADAIASKFGEERLALITSSKKMLDDAGELIQAMDLAVRELPSADRPNGQRTLEESRSKLTQLKKRTNAAAANLPDEAKMRQDLSVAWRPC